MSALAPTNRAVKPFWIARYPMATPRWVLPRPGRPDRRQVAPLGDQLGPEVRSELLAPEARLEDEVELLDGLDEWEVGVPRSFLDARVVAVRNLLGDDQCQEVPMRPPLGRRARGVARVQAPHRRQVKALEERVQIDVAGVHAATKAARTAATV